MLDFGSNSTRMSITQIAPDGSFKEVKRAKEMTRLAEGMGQSDGQKILQPQAIQRTLGALLKFKKIYRDLPNVSVRGVRRKTKANFYNKSRKLRILMLKCSQEVQKPIMII
jgi:exopolyphosphatase/guanosine-5'-triphosphate,3'-diphosphate pyrophosphatase